MIVIVRYVSNAKTNLESNNQNNVLDHKTGWLFCGI